MDGPSQLHLDLEVICFHLLRGMNQANAAPGTGVHNVRGRASDDACAVVADLTSVDAAVVAAQTKQLLFQGFTATLAGAFFFGFFGLAASNSSHWQPSWKQNPG